MNNERIQKLMEHATEKPSFAGDVGYFNPEKFAELIVREITNMLPADSIRNEEGVHMFYVIRDHFGVSKFGK